MTNTYNNLKLMKEIRYKIHKHLIVCIHKKVDNVMILLILICRNISRHALMGRPDAILKTMVLAKQTYVRVQKGGKSQ